MTQKNTTKLSLANTPVRRAISRANKHALLILIALGFIAGLVYNAYFK